MNTVTTFHTYPLLIGQNAKQHGRLARSVWEGRTLTLADGIRTTLAMDPEAVVLFARLHDGISPLTVGLGPGGLSA